MIYVVIGVVISLLFNILGVKWLLGQRKVIKSLEDKNKKLGAMYGEALDDIQTIRSIYENNANASHDDLLGFLHDKDAVRGSGSGLHDSAGKADRISNRRSRNTAGSSTLHQTKGGGL